jgi:hypothetical protein
MAVVPYTATIRYIHVGQSINDAVGNDRYRIETDDPMVR